MTRFGISYEEALALLLASMGPLGAEQVGLNEAVGRVLASDLSVARAALTVTAGLPLRPETIGLLAAAGMSSVWVVRRPRVAIVAAGNELLSPGAPPVAGKIYDTDSALLAALVCRDGGQPLMIGIAHDNVESLRMRLSAAIAGGAELILTAAGSHHGEHDIVRALLEREGRLHFCQVAMEPDRPLLFGDLAGVPVLGLPGDPAEALVCAELFARPALLRLGGRVDLERPLVRALLDSPVERQRRRHYRRAMVRHVGDGYAVCMGAAAGGGATSLTAANALVLIPPGEGALPAGSPVEALLIEPPALG
jgi:molybdopterin molybdotransferase